MMNDFSTASKVSERRLQLEKRSQFLQRLRAFFYQRQVLEVDTPMLSQGATPDVHLRSLSSWLQVPGERERQEYFWHTSPEYPMKRLLCEGSGDIFYLGKVFRDGDLSPRHQIEFTMLEWYRVGFSLQELIDEVMELLNQLLPELREVQQLSYRQAFAEFAGVEDIFHASAEQCRACLQRHKVPEIVGVDENDKTLWEQLILTEVIEPQLGQGVITVLKDFPARDAALALIDPQNPEVAERFEVFVDAMELANGYHELADAGLYRQRFEESLAQRAQLGLPQVPLDQKLLQTLTEKPLPDCCGVALGVDRLLMLQQGERQIEAVIPFGVRQA
ncbi:EF-P lysine aminoacylase EpmA [Thiomicrorhabdus xiamenensis]|nr:EF-P lysine aminoacylase EpmA [Thiomicrorhabdus xiamenensis]